MSAPRRLDPALVEALKKRAKKHDRSREAEHREILRDALRPGPKGFRDDVALRAEDVIVAPRRPRPSEGLEAFRTREWRATSA